VPLTNLSRNSGNLIGLYELGPVTARVAYNWRGRFSTGTANIVGMGAVNTYTRGYGWLDASLRYRVNPQLTLALEGNNLLATRRVSYYGVETRPQSVWANDVQIGVSATLRF
jgi:outer membrane receptor protein involved in Fe transport